ncbi:CHAT domain-containing protein [Saccharothrix stipae]
MASHLAFDTLDPWEVLQVTEQARLAASRSSVKRTPTPALNDLLTEMRYLARELSLSTRSSVEQSTLHTRLERLRVDAALLGWTEKSPDVVSAADLRHALGNRILVSFTVSRDELSALVIASNAAHIVSLGPPDVTAEAAARLRADLSALALDEAQRGPVGSVLRASAQKAARWLDDALVKPLVGLIGDHDLVILPAWALHTVPWGCLASLSNRSIVVAPSATMWATREHPRDDGRVVVVAGPHASPDVTQLVHHHAHADLFTGDRATGASVLAAMDGARLVHLAVHASNQHENTALSAIQLVDRAVFAHEFVELARPPEIVVLDGPSVGAEWRYGRQHEFGLADGLLRAGVRTVVVAAGDVGVAAGAEAMRDIHTALAQGESPARAVAEVSRRNPFHRPYLCIGYG